MQALDRLILTVDLMPPERREELLAKTLALLEALGAPVGGQPESSV